MTAPDYAAMTDAQLNEAAALVMGWHSKRANSQRYFNSAGGLAVFSWCPRNNLNDSGKFLSHFLAAHPLFQVTETTLIVQVDGVQVRHWQVVLWRGLAPSGVEFHAVDKSKARAETIAVLRAWEGMK